MPFKSERQRRWMFDNHPEIAKDMAKTDSVLPESGKYERKEASFNTFRDFLSKSGEDVASEEREANKTASITDVPDFQPEDLIISKYAGAVIYDNTPEGIEQYLTQLILNEISFFPDKVNVNIELLPMDARQINGAPLSSPRIDNATGVAQLAYGGTSVDIPFMIRDRELLPFDAIQLGGERAVFTRDNLKKVLFGIKYQQLTGTVGPKATDSAFAGVDRDENKVMTDHGFMNDVLKVQELAGNDYRVASEAIDDLLEKTAGFERVNINYDELRTTLTAEYMEEAEKIASCDYEEGPMDQLVKTALFDQIEDLKLLNVAMHDAGESIEFPEKDGAVLGMTKAKVVKKLVGPKGRQSGRTLILSIDGRFKDLINGQKFMGKKADDTPWNLTMRNPEGLNQGRKYTGVVAKDWFVPFMVEKAILGANKGLKMRFAYECVDGNFNKFMIVHVPGTMKNAIEFKKKEDIFREFFNSEPADKLAAYSIILKDVPIAVVPDSAQFVELIGEITNPVMDKKALFYVEDEDFLKTASPTEYVQIILTNQDKPAQYDIDVVWIDKRANIPAERKIHFKGASEGKVKGVLKTVGFSFNEASAIVYKASKESKAIEGIKANHTPWKVKPDVVAAGMADTTISRLRQAFFDRGAIEKAVTKGSSAFISGAVDSNGLTGNFLGGLGVYASESEALAQKLEKVAQARQSESFLKIAKLMVIKNRVDSVLKDVVNNGVEYDNTIETLASLHTLTPVLEKTAYDLIKLKVAQAQNHNEIVSPNVIQATLNHLNDLHKYASIFGE